MFIERRVVGIRIPLLQRFGAKTDSNSMLTWASYSPGDEKGGWPFKVARFDAATGQRAEPLIVRSDHRGGAVSCGSQRSLPQDVQPMVAKAPPQRDLAQTQSQ
jgi:hypothetical protein